MKKILTALGIFLATSAIAEDENWHNGKYLALCYADPFETGYNIASMVWLEIDRNKNTMMVRTMSEKIGEKIEAKIIYFDPKGQVFAETELTALERYAFYYRLFTAKLRVTGIDYVDAEMRHDVYKCIEYDYIHIPSRD